MKKLLLPLHCYDAAGHIKPPRVLWWVLAFMSKSYLIFIAALTTGELAEYSLRLVYPKTRDLYMGFGTGTFGLFVVVMVSFREALWQREKHALFVLLKPTIVVGMIFDLSLCLLLLQEQKWAFSWGVAFRLLGNVFCLWWVAASRHLRWMNRDWQRAE